MAHRAPPERRRPRWLAWIPVVLIAGAAILLIINFWPSPPSAPTSDLLPAASASTRSPVTHPPTPTPSSSPQLTVVTVTDTVPCWVQLTAGAKTVYVGTLQPGAAMTWRIQPPGTLLLGNPSGVTVTVNGVQQPDTSMTLPITQGN